MIDLLEIEKFINKNVRLGIPHKLDNTKLFFYYGIITEVDDRNSEIKLEMEKGIKIIPLDDIKEINIL